MLFPFYLSRGGSRSAATLEEEFNMGFPFSAEENFETGTLGIFTEVADTLGKLSVVGPQDAHEIPPYLGGYVLEVDLNRGTAPASASIGAPITFANGTTKYARLMVWLSADLKLPNPGDSMRIFNIESGAFAEEAAIGLVRGNKGELMLGVFSPDLNDWIRGIEVSRDMWLPLEIAMISVTAGASKLQVMCMGSQVEAVGMTWATLTRCRIGAITQSDDIRGKIWFDHFVVDDTSRLVAPQPLDPRELDGETILFTKSAYAFVGPGEVDCLTLISAAADSAVNLYDTDRLPFAQHDMRMSAKAAAAESIESKGTKIFKRGCYVSFSGAGTNPQAIVQLGAVTEFGWGAGGEEGYE